MAVDWGGGGGVVGCDRPPLLKYNEKIMKNWGKLSESG